MARIQVSVVSRMQDDGQHLFLVKETEEATQTRPETEPVQGKIEASCFDFLIAPPI